MSTKSEKMQNTHPFLRPRCSVTESELDPKLFAHIHLDSRLVGTYLEGNYFSVTSGYIRKMLHFIAEHTDLCSITKETQEEIRNSLEKLEKQFEYASKIESWEKEIVEGISAEIRSEAKQKYSNSRIDARIFKAFSKQDIFCYRKWGR